MAQNCNSISGYSPAKWKPKPAVSRIICQLGYEQPEFRRRVLAEFDKIPAYLRAGYLREIPATTPPNAKKP